MQRVGSMYVKLALRPLTETLRIPVEPSAKALNTHCLLHDTVFKEDTALFAVQWHFPYLPISCQRKKR